MEDPDGVGPSRHWSRWRCCSHSPSRCNRPLPEPVLVSQGRPATASSAEGPFAAAAAVDGDPGTRWSSQFTDAQWIHVDLGATTAISRVVLRWEAA
ncbi:discoidin domain-containing protein [Streptomyces sp. NPDC056437]|uniref:discoidin domain-containing protein n=1 Tax=Streptomyces sp. NPDC056437 TaxID=3345816 RepID=UPI003699A81A